MNFEKSAKGTSKLEAKFVNMYSTTRDPWTNRIFYIGVLLSYSHDKYNLLSLNVLTKFVGFSGVVKNDETVLAG